MEAVLLTVGHPCPLCDEARALLESLGRSHAFSVREVVVGASDPRALRVPVLFVDGREVAHGRLSPEALRAVLPLGPAPRSSG